MLFFKKEYSVQMLAIYYQKEYYYGPEVKERIIRSAEIEILETKK
jgi:hypothetical protein